MDRKYSNYKPNSQQQAQLKLLLSLLDEAEKQNIQVVVVGGYGLDALHGKLTRDHRDFDFHINLDGKSKFIHILAGLDFFPTGNLVGNVVKEEYVNPKFADFTIEVGIIENGLKLLSPEQQVDLLPSHPIGFLNQHPIPTPTWKGYKNIIEINNRLATKNMDGQYRHSEWMKEIFTQLEKKFGNSNN